MGSFAAPTYVAVAPGQPQLLFVVERAGRIQILRNEQKLATPFLNISAIVRGPPDSGAGGEEGLLSMAFAPDYATSRRFYVAFTNLNGDVEIDEFRRSTESAMLADPASRRAVLAIPHRNATNHNGGQLQFGPDGYLYISVGDGGGGVAPTGDAARNLSLLLGKILRIRPLQSGAQRYTVPSSNPFVGRAGHDAIFAYGLRNPWRFSFDGAVIIIADVGQQRREEVNVIGLPVATGANFGWPQYEAELPFAPNRPGPHPPRFPVFKYDHSRGCAVVGGYVVRDSSLPGLVGRYLYGDACTGVLRSIIRNGPPDDLAAGVTVSGLSSFGRGVSGQLYAAAISGLSGAVYRLEP